MMRTLRIFITLLAAAAICAPAPRHRSKRRNSAAPPGSFDFYVFVLSWSPEFCYSHPSAAQCSQRTGFIVHGLWPQNSDGTFSLNCQTNQPPPTHPDAMGDIMPPEIIEHEWKQHGTCSGLSGDDYFALIRKLYETIHIPERLKQPSSSFTISTRDLKRSFEQANPGLDDTEMSVQLRGNYLNAVRFCEMKGQKPTPTPCSGLPDTRQGTFVVPPVH